MAVKFKNPIDFFEKACVRGWGKYHVKSILGRVKGLSFSHNNNGSLTLLTDEGDRYALGRIECGLYYPSDVVINYYFYSGFGLEFSNFKLKKLNLNHPYMPAKIGDKHLFIRKNSQFLFSCDNHSFIFPDQSLFIRYKHDTYEQLNRQFISQWALLLTYIRLGYLPSKEKAQFSWSEAANLFMNDSVFDPVLFYTNVNLSSSMSRQLRLDILKLYRKKIHNEVISSLSGYTYKAIDPIICVPPRFNLVNVEVS